MKYKTILADPPWQYQNKGVEGAAEKHYPTMKKHELRGLNVEAISTPETVLIMWATWPLVDEAIALGTAWGFSYVTGFPWVKLQLSPTFDLFGEPHIVPTYGTGFWVRGCSEPIFIFKRKEAKVPATDFLGLISERMKHSKKPASIYHYAETSFQSPRVELFARQKRDGWDSIGNGIDGKDIREVLGVVKV
ncbi:MAG: DNA methyltransferase [Ketobacter sp.]|nr:DNA methyltransferase [Ketobacter sp.]